MGYDPFAPAPGSGSSANIPKTGGNGKLIAIISIIAVVVIATVLVVFLVVSKGGGGGTDTPEEAAVTYINALLDRSPSKVINIMFPSFMHSAVDDACVKMTGMSFSDYLETTIDEEDYNAEIRNLKTEVRRTYEQDDIDELRAEFKKNFGTEIEIPEAQRIRISFEIKGTFDGDSYPDWEEESNTVTIYKYDGKWYCYD